MAGELLTHEEKLNETLAKHLEGENSASDIEIICKWVLARNNSGGDDDLLRRRLGKTQLSLCDSDSDIGVTSVGQDAALPSLRKEIEERLQEAANLKSALHSFLGFLDDADWKRMRDTNHQLQVNWYAEGYPASFLCNVESSIRGMVIPEDAVDIQLVFLQRSGKASPALPIDFSKSLQAADRCYSILRFLRDPSDLMELCTAFSNTTKELKRSDEDDAVDLDYVKGLVDVSAEFDEDSLFFGGGRHNTLVIGGESGSGKSWHAAFAVARDVPRLYLEVKSKDLGQDGTQRVGPAKNKASWNYLGLAEKVRTVANALNPGSDEMLKVVKEALHRSCTTLYEGRNSWITAFLDYKIRALERECTEWFVDGTGVQLDHFLLVVDEVGRDKDLLHGLIDFGHQYLRKKLHGKVKKCGLVLAGTSLDDLYGGNSDEPLAGSNPDSVQVIVMKEANVGSFVEAAQLQYMNASGVSNGLYSGPFSTNVRILVRILRPFFESKYGSHHEEDATKARHIQSLVGSSYPAMAFVPPSYCQYNGMRTQVKKRRQELFEVAFCSLLRTSVMESHLKLQNLTEVMNHLVNSVWTSDAEEEAKKAGLVTTDPQHTTAAVKLLASKGLAAPVIKGDCASLEYSLSLSLVRQLECAGYTCRTYTLQGAWPPPWNKIPTNFSDVPDMLISEAHKRDLSIIKHFLSAGQSRAIVLIQGVPNAQGPDVMVLRPSSLGEAEMSGVTDLSLDSLDDSFSVEIPDVHATMPTQDFSLDVYQSKNVRSSTNTDDMTRTLGVIRGNRELATTHSSSLQTENELSALYSAKAIDTFCTKLGGSVVVKDRVLVKPEERSFRGEGLVKLWTNHHLEPCFSIFQGNINH